ncbi:MAG: thioredoxin-like domain-containing protein [Flavipsychrobacter sp.]
MKRIILFSFLLIAGIAQSVFAKDGYHLQVKIEGAKDTLIYLAHYYGKPLPAPIYKADSARPDKNGVVVFNSKTPIVGGIYMVLLSDHKSYFEFLLNNGDNFSMTINTKAKEGDNAVTFKNSPENDHFTDYITFLKAYGEKQNKLQESLKTAKNSEEKASIRKLLNSNSQSLITYRAEKRKEYPGSLMADIFGALQLPQVPEGKHLLPNGEPDSNFAYEYYKAHFWDGFNFQDDRLIYTPIYDAKLTEYFNKLVLPYPDSMEMEADKILAKARGTQEVFKYTLWWLEHMAQDSKVMGMDAVVVYLVENYYMKGDATWLSNEDLNKYIDYAEKIAPNVLGNKAPEIVMPDINGKDQSLLDLKAKYTLLVFWSADCSHCMAEMPQIDSVYNAVLKDKGVKIYAVRADGDEARWKDYIKKHHLEDWVNVQDPDHTRQQYRSKYDVYSTPVIYLLDDKKIIRGKRLDHSNIMEVIEMLERKAKTTSK